MALSKAGLKTLIVAEMEGQGITTVGEFAYAGKLAEAIANAVVDHIVAAAELVPVTTDQGNAGAGIITGKVK